MARFGFVRPAGDRSAETLSSWGNGCRAPVVAADHEITFDLHPLFPWSHLTAREVLARLPSCDVVLFFGHGLTDQWLGPNTLIGLQDASTTSNKIVVAIACSTAEELGRACVAHGARAYLGFSDELSWARNYSDEFGTVVRLAVASLAQGNPIENARNVLANGFDSLYESFKNGPNRTRQDAEIVWLAATWNVSIVALVGDPTVRA